MPVTREYTLQAAVVLLAAIAPVGCARQRMLTATTIPSEYAVAHVQNAQVIDLSKLATSTVSSESIDRGDVLEISIESGYEEDHSHSAVPVRVGEDGAAQVPLIGRVQVAGFEPAGAEEAIRAAAVERGVFRNPNVTVLMKQQRMNKVTVVGAVKEPGTYELPRSNSALLSAILAAAGLSEEAGTEVEIRRPALRNESGTGAHDDRVAAGPNQLTAYEQPSNTLRPASSLRIDLVAATRQSAANPNWYLDDGDVVMVEKRDPQPVHVIGLVNKPGQVPLPANKDLHLLDAVAQAGGASSPYLDKVHVIRRVPGQETPLVIKVSLREAKTKGQGNMRLGPGDVVSVEQTPANFSMDMVKTFSPYTIGATLGATLPILLK